MTCPECGSDQTPVQQTFRAELGGLSCPKRRRKCADCGHIFYTVEIPTEWVEEKQ